MMLFYESAGGRGYTGLSHDYQAFVDLSHVPNLNRAVLVGEIDGRATDILIDGEPPSPNSYDRQLTILRVSLPVQRTQREKQQTK